LQELTSKLFTERIMSANKISHIDLDALETMSQRKLDQFILTTGNA
jgi:hypothetical protein